MQFAIPKLERGGGIERWIQAKIEKRILSTANGNHLHKFIIRIIFIFTNTWWATFIIFIHRNSNPTTITTTIIRRLPFTFTFYFFSRRKWRRGIIRKQRHRVGSFEKGEFKWNGHLFVFLSILWIEDW